jgi:hypothetical protein
MSKCLSFGVRCSERSENRIATEIQIEKVTERRGQRCHSGAKRTRKGTIVPIWGEEVGVPGYSNELDGLG